MATAEEYAAWIVKNQDKRDTPEFQTVVQAYQLAKSRPKTELAPMNVDPTEGMTTGEKFRAGMGKAFVDVGRGIGQAVGLVSSDDVNESKRLDAPLMKTTAGTVGNIAGNVAAFAPTAMIPGSNTVTGAALVGAVANALATPGNFGDRALAAGLGGAGGAVGQLIPKAIGVMRSASEPLTAAGREKIIGRTINKAVGDDSAKVAARLRLGVPLVPGSAPTAAEIGESGGLAALQRAMSSADPEAYTQRGMQQSSARLQVLRDIAGDDATRAAALKARDAATKDAYAQAKNTSYIVDDSLDNLLQRPLVKKALGRAEEIAKNDGRPFGINATTSAPFSGVGGKSAEKVNSITGYSLQDIKMAMDDMLKDPASGIVGKEAEQARNLRGSIVSWMEKANPEFKAARTTYANMSQPINQMDVGKALLEKVTPALSDYGALSKETAAKYAQALRNSDDLVKNATGFKGTDLESVMGPQKMQSLESVAKDLARKANAQDLGRGPGSNTYQNFAMDNLAQSMGVPSAVKGIAGLIPGMSPTMTLLAKGAQGVGGLAYKNADEAIRKDMAQALLNPQASARLMELASQPGALAKALQALPPNMQKALPPEEILRLLQASPGLAGVGLANARQE